MTVRERQALTAVARGQARADVYVRGGTPDVRPGRGPAAATLAALVLLAVAAAIPGEASPAVALGVRRDVGRRVTSAAVTLPGARPRGSRGDGSSGPGPAAPSGFLHGAFEGQAYRLYVPGPARVEGAAPAPDQRDAGPAPAALPLVVALHGCWQTPEDFALGTRLNEAAERRRLLVLYPAQSPAANATRCWNWFVPPRAGAGEAGRLLGVVRAVSEAQAAAADRVIVVGLSAGAFMAVNLVCTAPEVFTGIGAVAGGPFRCASASAGAVGCLRGQDLNAAAAATACRAQMGARARAVRASLWHGEGDSVVSPANMYALALMFRQLAGLAGPHEERRDGVVHGVWTDRAGRPALETWLVPGMGHAWSGGDRRGTHTYPAGLDATERMLDFLLGSPSGA